MSKDKQRSKSNFSAAIMLGHEGEYRVIKHDLLRVVILNVLYLAGVLVIYFTNAKSHYLEQWAARWFHF